MREYFCGPLNTIIYLHICRIVIKQRRNRRHAYVYICSTYIFRLAQSRASANTISGNAQFTYSPCDIIILLVRIQIIIVVSINTQLK